MKFWIDIFQNLYFFISLNLTIFNVIMFPKSQNSQVVMYSPQQRIQPPQQQNPRKVIDKFSYGLNELIGKGFSSQVYQGRNEQTGELVAVKVIEMALLKTPLHHALLRSEIESLQSLQQDNVIKLHQVFQTNNNTYIITEFCEGGDLGTKLKTENKMSEATVANIMIGVVKGYKALKQQGIIHRDLKPANILMKEGQPKIADFGFATTPRSRMTMPNVNVGSPLYMSPQALRQNSYSEGSDIWAIGSSAYELIFGAVPWQANSEKELAQKMMTIPPEFPLSVSEECKNFIRRCLAPDENQRATIEELENHLWLKKRYVQQRAIQSAQKALKSPIIQVKEMSNCRPFKQSPLALKAKQFILPPPLKENQQQLVEVPKCSKSFIAPFRAHNTETKKPILKNISKKSTDFSVSDEKAFRTTEKKEQKSTEFKSERISQESFDSQVNNDLNHQSQLKNNDFVILAQLNFCRYLFRLTQLVDKGYTGKGKGKILFIIFKHLMMKITRLRKIIDGNNILELTDFSMYQEMDTYKQLSYAIDQYYKKYGFQFTNYWLTYFLTNKEQIASGMEDFFNQDFSESTNFESSVAVYIRESIVTLQQQLNCVTLEEGYVPLEIEPTLVLLDYLVTYLQLVTMFKWNDWKLFAQQSRIEQIAQGKPVRLTNIHFNEIKLKIKDVL